jgi:dipeptidase
MDPSQLIAHLNALSVGEMDVIQGKLAQARLACRELDQGELADKLREAEQALAQADVKRYRKCVETVIAKLGHIR